MGRSSKPNIILAQIGIYSVNVLHRNVKSTKENSNLGKKLKGFLKSATLANSIMFLIHLKLKQ